MRLDCVDRRCTPNLLGEAAAEYDDLRCVGCDGVSGLYGVGVREHTYLVSERRLGLQDRDFIR